ncbi:hypothetical protein KUCAC02_029744 [Chaenocephalus aceratus]|nr:hypothetical protein KUCAC02_029744 [Chaenocephalus aceratus]
MLSISSVAREAVNGPRQTVRGEGISEGLQSENDMGDETADHSTLEAGCYVESALCAARPLTDLHSAFSSALFASDETDEAWVNGKWDRYRSVKEIPAAVPRTWADVEPSAVSWLLLGECAEGSRRGRAAVCEYTVQEKGEAAVCEYTVQEKGEAAVCEYTVQEKGEAAVCEYTVQEKGEAAVCEYTVQEKGEAAVCEYTVQEKGEAAVCEYTVQEKGEAAVCEYTVQEKGEAVVCLPRRYTLLSMDTARWVTG